MAAIGERVAGQDRSAAATLSRFTQTAAFYHLLPLQEIHRRPLWSWPRSRPSRRFGGDVDNFEIIRGSTSDICFFRAYEKGKRRVHSEHFLPWKQQGTPRKVIWSFVSGNPGNDEPGWKRLAKLRHAVTVTLPLQPKSGPCDPDGSPAAAFSPKVPEQGPHGGKTTCHRFANARKALSGQYRGCWDSKDLL